MSVKIAVNNRIVIIMTAGVLAMILAAVEIVTEAVIAAKKIVVDMIAIGATSVNANHRVLARGEHEQVGARECPRTKRLYHQQRWTSSR